MEKSLKLEHYTTAKHNGLPCCMVMDTHTVLIPLTIHPPSQTNM